MLTLVPTPIGNLEDITLRALRVLREADFIACEDTRTSSILLRHHGITDKKLISFHAHNENEKLPFLLERLKNGYNIALVSDAGMPGVSDPGWILLKRAMDEGLEVDVLPGPSALLPAVLMSGLTPQPFVFMGFVPEKGTERLRLLEGMKSLMFTSCFYLSPHKADRHLQDMLDVFGDRNAAIVREISKVYQESIRGSLSGLIERVREGVKGELVLVVEGNVNEGSSDWKDEAMSLREEGASTRDIVEAITAKYNNVSRNDVKRLVLRDFS